MSFEHPASWWWAALAALIAAWYLWQFSSRRQEVATLFLWERALARRPAWYRLRFWASLAAQIGLLGLLVAALAEAVWQPAPRRRHVVLVVDVSASMSARDLSPSRLACALVEAERLVGELRRRERMAVIAAGSLIRVACPLTEDPQALRDALSGLAPSDGVTRVDEAVALARRLLEGRPNPAIIVLSDGGFPQAAALAQAGDVECIPFRQRTQNVGIVDLSAEPSRIEPGVCQVFVQVVNASDQPLRCPLEIGLDGQPPQIVELELEPLGTSRQLLKLAVPRGGLVRARLDHDDDLASDNAAVGYLESLAAPRIALMAEPAPVVERIRQALEAIPGVRLTAGASAPAAGADVTVWYRQVPESFPAGTHLVLDPQTACDLWEPAGTIRGPDAAVQQGGESAEWLVDLDLAGVACEQAARLQFQVPAQPLLRAASGEPLCTRLSRPQGAVLVFHLSLERDHSDLVLRREFPWLLQRAVGQLLSPPGSTWLATTTSRVTPLPAPAAGQSWTAPDGTQREFRANQTWAVLDRTGLWKPAGGEQTGSGGAVASNLVCRAESALAAELPVTPSERRPPAADRPLWLELIGLVAILAAVEVCLFHRRVTV